ncbi:MAG: hypothetical protein ACLSWY_04680 [Ruthenibacterium lactatiformans]
MARIGAGRAAGAERGYAAPAGAVRAAQQMEGRSARPRRESRRRIAVARDEAFCFAYAETLNPSGTRARSLYFQPVHDCAARGAGGLYLPGGYRAVRRQLS